MHEQITHLAQFWGLIYAVILFGAAVAYALWPSNRRTFDRAAHAPLANEDDNATHD
jgi:cytochrome c oxidase cbb3-type subunit IV